MWLLDVNLPKRLAEVLGGAGMEAQHADARGWGGLTNGNLVEAAVEAGFTCLLTRDRLFGASASRALKQFPAFAVVLVTLPQLRGPAFLEEFRRAWERSPIRPYAGRLLRWPE
jgi:predicted nuclease of predicted toxin-antitoxin system